MLKELHFYELISSTNASQGYMLHCLNQFHISPLSHEHKYTFHETLHDICLCKSIMNTNQATSYTTNDA